MVTLYVQLNVFKCHWSLTNILQFRKLGADIEPCCLMHIETYGSRPHTHVPSVKVCLKAMGVELSTLQIR